MKDPQDVTPPETAARSDAVAPPRRRVGLPQMPGDLPRTHSDRRRARVGNFVVGVLALAWCSQFVFLHVASGGRTFSAWTLLAVPLAALTAGPIVLYASRKAAQRRHDQHVVSTPKDRAREAWPTFPVRFSSERHFRTWWKRCVRESTGVLSLGPEGVTLRSTQRRRTAERRFEAGTAHVEWIGRVMWPNGGVSWFAIEADGRRTYFTSETGATIFGSEQSTRAIYEHVVAS